MMKNEYDISDVHESNRAYLCKDKKAVTIRLCEDVIDYFKVMAEETGVPYQCLINLYLNDCTNQKKSIDISWYAK